MWRIFPVDCASVCVAIVAVAGGRVDGYLSVINEPPYFGQVRQILPTYTSNSSGHGKHMGLICRDLRYYHYILEAFLNCDNAGIIQQLLVIDFFTMNSAMMHNGLSIDFFPMNCAMMHNGLKHRLLYYEL